MAYGETYGSTVEITTTTSSRNICWGYVQFFGWILPLSTPGIYQVNWGVIKVCKCSPEGCSSRRNVTHGLRFGPDPVLPKETFFSAEICEDECTDCQTQDCWCCPYSDENGVPGPRREKGSFVWAPITPEDKADPLAGVEREVTEISKDHLDVSCKCEAPPQA